GDVRLAAPLARRRRPRRTPRAALLLPGGRHRVHGQGPSRRPRLLRPEQRRRAPNEDEAHGGRRRSPLLLPRPQPRPDAARVRLAGAGEAGAPFLARDVDARLHPPERVSTHELEERRRGHRRRTAVPTRRQLSDCYHRRFSASLTPTLSTSSW